MSSNEFDELRHSPAEWTLEQELEVAGEVYGPAPAELHELSEEDLLERFKSMLGFQVNWE